MHLPIRYLSIAGGAVVLLGGAATLLSRVKRKSDEDRERERRDRLNRHGRIIDGTVIDFAELANVNDPEGPPTQLLIYRYEISGVVYEASQDVTTLRQFVDVHSCKLGLPASIKYDPHSPQNSIVICETWSGLRSGPISPRMLRSEVLLNEKKSQAELFSQR